MNTWEAGDGTVWLFVPETNEWTGWQPGEDGVWIKTPAEMDVSYPDHPRAPRP